MASFPTTYQALSQNKFTNKEASIVPIRYQDRQLIMKWRNEQMYHLRQKTPLTEQNQEDYFKNVVSKLFSENKPSQLLFSYLINDELAGYGGLVHIDWDAKKAEISFIMNTELETEHFDFHWSTYLPLIEEVGFSELGFNTLFTYAYDLRPHLYKTLERNEYQLKSHLKNEIEIDGEMKDVLIHEKNNPVSLRLADSGDTDLLFHWSNDPLTRSQSYNDETISLETHTTWFSGKLKNEDSTIYILQHNDIPCGVVRFEKNEDHAVIGISVSPDYRGRRLAKPMLNLACSEYLLKNPIPIYAYIKTSNSASIKSFQRAKFSYNKEIEMHGSPSVLYIRNA